MQVMATSHVTTELTEKEKSDLVSEYNMTCMCLNSDVTHNNNFFNHNVVVTLYLCRFIRAKLIR